MSESSPTAPAAAALPESPRLFLVDGYALIYRAFFALISRPLTTSRGENTSAAWGIVNFLQRLLATHRPEYLGWVHDSGLSFRHETYPAYKATRQKQSADAGVNVVIVSGDKDFQQLVRPGVWLLNPGRGGPAAVDEQWVSVENGAERLGVPPERTIDYLALVGDSSDNVPGVRGIGDKTARDLVLRYGPLESILAHAEEITQ